LSELSGYYTAECCWTWYGPITGINSNFKAMFIGIRSTILTTSQKVYVPVYAHRAVI